MKKKGSKIATDHLLRNSAEEDNVERVTHAKLP